MKPRVIVTSVIGEKYQAIWKLTRPTFERYADRTSADLVILGENPHMVSAHWVKFALHDILHKMYRRAAWIDADIIIREDAPDLFAEIPEDKLGIFNEGRFTPRAIAIYEAMQKYRVELPDWDRISYFNTGVMVVGQGQRHLFRTPVGIKEQRYSFGEQTFLNLRILQQGIPVHELSHHFNHMSIMDRLTGISRLASYFVHYAGYPGEGLLNIIKDDLKRWEQDGPEYHYDPVLFLNIGGGLGDQVCAEPVVRYIRANLYPEAEIYAISAYPDLFGHISGVYVDSKMPDKKFDAVYSINLHPDKKTPHNQYTIHTLSHPVDYISLTALKRILPAKDKQIKLDLWRMGRRETFFYTDLENMVIVHPGQGWDSKTFPSKWWQAVIDGLEDAGFRVGIIGKTIGGEHGYLPVSIPENGVDFRDKLSIMGLAALLRYAPVLISNDSAPVHIAGAFDNNIILIPTCKHPEHLLPYRHGSIWYKASALYKALACEEYHFRPTDVEVRSITQTVQPIENYLPDPREVIDEVKTLRLPDGNLLLRSAKPTGNILENDTDHPLIFQKKGQDHEYYALQSN